MISHPICKNLIVAAFLATATAAVIYIYNQRKNRVAEKSEATNRQLDHTQKCDSHGLSSDDEGDRCFSLAGTGKEEKKPNPTSFLLASKQQDAPSSVRGEPQVPTADSDSGVTTSSGSENQSKEMRKKKKKRVKKSKKQRKVKSGESEQSGTDASKGKALKKVESRSSNGEMKGVKTAEDMSSFSSGETKGVSTASELNSSGENKDLNAAPDHTTGEAKGFLTPISSPK